MSDSHYPKTQFGCEFMGETGCAPVGHNGGLGNGGRATRGFQGGLQRAYVGEEWKDTGALLVRAQYTIKFPLSKDPVWGFSLWWSTS